MPGIYVHIPFCHRACHYCNFHFSTNLKSIDNTLSAIGLEAELLSASLENVTFTTLYFGGGTPSLLSVEQLSRLIGLIHRLYTLNLTECTLEANPEDIIGEKLYAWQDMGINRLSIGIQTFNESNLKKFNRNHTAKQALDCIEISKSAGFQHFNVDLIFGFPNQSLEDWNRDLDTLLPLRPQHISVYALTREEGTAYDYMHRKGLTADVDDVLLSDMFFLARERLTGAGYCHYEISNYALPGHESRHNSSYWSGDSYLGLGPSAHSYLTDVRRWNIAHNARYEKALFSGKKWYEEETITRTKRFNERIIIGIRTNKGINLAECIPLLTDTEYAKWNKNLENLLNKGVFSLENHHIKLNPSYLFLADTFTVDLMI